MKQIDKQFPIFAQIEDGDHIFLFNAYTSKPLETIKAVIPVPTNNFFNVLLELLISSICFSVCSSSVIISSTLKMEW